MENPNTFLRSLWLVGLGACLIAIPSMIRMQQLSQQIETEREDANARVATLRDLANKNAERATNEKRDCDAALVADGTQTIIVTQLHPYAGWQQRISGITLMVPQPDSPVIVSPVLIVNGKVAPRALDGITGAVYTHIWPDGRTDGWKAPGAAQ